MHIDIFLTISAEFLRALTLEKFFCFLKKSRIHLPLLSPEFSISRDKVEENPNTPRDWIPLYSLKVPDFLQFVFSWGKTSLHYQTYRIIAWRKDFHRVDG